MARQPLHLTLVLDALCILAVCLLAYILRAELGVGLQPFSFYVPLFAAGVVAIVVCGAAMSLYDDSRVLFSLPYVSDFIRAYFLWGFCMIAFPFFIKTQYSRAIIVFMLIASFFALYGVRLLLVLMSRTPVSSTHEVHRAVGDVSKLLQVTSDPLTLLTGMRMSRPSSVARAAKRILDILIAVPALMAVGIALPFIATWIKKTSAGPVFIVQTRIGKDGKSFRMYKFRTMYVTTDLYAPAPRTDSDARVTSAGKSMRKYSIDELPQFWNVLTGDMSLVGPRPEMPFIVENYEEWQKARLQVTPGITGLWQIFGRKDLPLEENLEYDLYYVFNQSFFLDCAILLQTIPHLIGTKGAY